MKNPDFYLQERYRKYDKEEHKYKNKYIVSQFNENKLNLIKQDAKVKLQKQDQEKKANE